MRITKWMMAVSALFVTTAVCAQIYPNKSVPVIVPFSPGGATDVVARIVAQKLSEAWGQTLVVDNRPGAGGNIGGDLAAKSVPDGHTLFMAAGSIVTANQHLYKKMPFNPEKDLAAVTNVASGPQILIVHPSLPVKTVKEFIALAKARPKAINFGSAGFGAQNHLVVEDFIHASGIDVVHVPYKGAAAMVDLVAGQIQFAMPAIPTALALVNQGKLRALAVTSKERSRQLPNVPAMAESLKGFENVAWFGLMVPSATPRAIIDHIYRGAARALQSEDVRSRIEQLGMAVVGNTSEEFTAAIKAESARWARIIHQRKLQID